MNAEQKIKAAILTKVIASGDYDPQEDVTEESVDRLWDSAEEDDGGALQDARSEFREGQVETKIECDWSRHYESKSVAAQMPDGSWVGWTYWYGGGKHGEPEAIDWMDSAYDLECAEEEKLVVVRTFVKTTKTPAGV